MTLYQRYRRFLSGKRRYKAISPTTGDIRSVYAISIEDAQSKYTSWTIKKVLCSIF